MKVVVVSGSHPRHLYVVNKLLETGFVAGVVLMKREEMILEVPEGIKGHTRELYIQHFNLRMEMESLYFGESSIINASESIPVLEIERDELNSIKVEQFIRKIGADCLFSYGPDLFKENILDCVDGFALNLHGGLSPWYKGAATMFWPFYFLEPNYVGTTLHYITKKIDAGNIVHQSVPVLEHGDTMHKVACKAIVAATADICNVINYMSKHGRPEGEMQKKTGKLFLERDWRPDHLHLVYDLYEDKIVDKFLDGEIIKKEDPHLVVAL